ncbi:MAG: hypothetical protein QXE31_01240 [Candidatus Woesearchaeota archaeon]
MDKKKFFVVSIIIISFILLLITIILFFNQIREERKIDITEIELMTKEEIIQYIYNKQAKDHLPFFYLVPLFSFFGILIGLLIYYIMSKDIEKNKEIIQHNGEIILKLLNTDERKVIKKIVENEGKILQMEITYMEGFTKVKSHRIIENLIKKGIVEKSDLGKTKMITLNKDLYHLIKDNKENNNKQTNN